jgi:uncharacterized protein YndB with AHSA1/START domain
MVEYQPQMETVMSGQDFTTSFTVRQTPQQAFEAITNVRGWWSEDISGGTAKAGDVFDYRFKDIHRTKVEIVEAVPGRRVVWHVLDNFFSFTADRSEWKDTRVVFDIIPLGAGAQVTMTHVGLVPDYECYDVCSSGWTTYVAGSLKSLIETGRGQPNVGEPMNASERKLDA